MQYQSILHYVEPGMKVLDAGCGEGTLSVLMAKKGAVVTGCDISEPNIRAAEKYAAEAKISASFLIADSEHLPFADSSFDLVVSSHVLEHLPDFDMGLKEAMRVTRNRAVIAIPTVFNACSLVQVGKGWFFLKGFRSFFALPWGFLRMCWALVTRAEGVDERYESENVPHVFRFPWILHSKARRLGFTVVAQEASSVCIPYFASFIPFIRVLDKHRAGVLKNLGYGTTYVLEKKSR
jgi:SAM-dependent methyltransferase